MPARVMKGSKKPKEFHGGGEEESAMAKPSRKCKLETPSEEEKRERNIGRER